MDRFESTPDTSLPARRPAATQARTQGPRDSASRRATGAGPGQTPGHDKAQGENNSPSPREETVPPAAPRERFTLLEIEMLRCFAIRGWYSRTAPDREEFLRIFPQATGMTRLLDIAEVVMKWAGETARQEERSERRRALEKRPGRKTGLRR